VSMLLVAFVSALLAGLNGEVTIMKCRVPECQYLVRCDHPPPATAKCGAGHVNTCPGRTVDHRPATESREP